MRIASIIAAILGLALAFGIVGYYGFADVAAAFLAIGWTGFFVVAAYHIALLLPFGLAWLAILPPPRPVGAAAFVFARLIRDSSAEVLPLSQLGGFVMAVRAVSLLGLPTVAAFASTLVDVTLETISQLAYTALGFGLLVLRHAHSALVVPVAVGLALTSGGVVGFVLVQRRGIGLLERLFPRRFGGLLELSRSTQQVIHAIYRYRSGLWAGFLLHLAGWIVYAGEAWVALRFMGVPVGFGTVLAIESLLSAMRSAAFAVPNAVGVQEGAYVVLADVFGLDPHTMLALSLLKRARDLTIGIPALLAWQALESRDLMRRRGIRR